MTESNEPLESRPPAAAEAPGKGLRWVAVLLVLVFGVAAGIEVQLRRKEARVAAKLEEIFEAASKAPDSVGKHAPQAREVMSLMQELNEVRRFRPWTKTFEDSKEIVPTILLQEVIATGNTRLRELQQAKTEAERGLAREALREHIARTRSTGKALKSPLFERNAKVFESFAKKLDEVRAAPAATGAK